MSLFKNKTVYVPEDVYEVKSSEREKVINELEERRTQINREIEALLVPYSKLVKKRSLRKRARKKCEIEHYFAPTVK